MLHNLYKCTTLLDIRVMILSYMNDTLIYTVLLNDYYIYVILYLTR